MPKLFCPCGFTHDLTPIPDMGWQTIRDMDIEKYVTANFKPTVEVGLAGLLYECHQCGRLMWKKPGATNFKVYKPEALPDGEGQNE
jgi:hypothetical protein